MTELHLTENQVLVLRAMLEGNRLIHEIASWTGLTSADVMGARGGLSLMLLETTAR